MPARPNNGRGQVGELYKPEARPTVELPTAAAIALVGMAREYAALGKALGNVQLSEGDQGWLRIVEGILYGEQRQHQ